MNQKSEPNIFLKSAAIIMKIMYHISAYDIELISDYDIRGHVISTIDLDMKKGHNSVNIATTSV